MNTKEKTELEVLLLIEHLHELRDVGNVHQTGEHPYYVWPGQGNYDGVGPAFPYEDYPTGEGNLWPMLPERFNELLAAKGPDHHILCWGGDVENIPEEHRIAIQDFRIAFGEAADSED